MSLFTFGLGSIGSGGISNSAGHAYPPAGACSLTGHAPVWTLVQGPIIAHILPATLTVTGKQPIPMPPYSFIEPAQLYLVEAEQRWMNVEAEDRMFDADEIRYFEVEAEDRYTVAEEEV